MRKLFLIFPFFIIQKALSSSYNVCPTMGCDADIGENVCFLHSGSNPVTYIRMY